MPGPRDHFLAESFLIGSGIVDPVACIWSFYISLPYEGRIIPRSLVIGVLRQLTGNKLRAVVACRDFVFACTHVGNQYLVPRVVLLT